MHILVLGATGFIGRHITSVLLGAGHRVTGAGRRTAELAHAFPGLDTLRLDLATATDADWQSALTVLPHPTMFLNNQVVASANCSRFLLSWAPVSGDPR